MDMIVKEQIGTLQKLLANLPQVDMPTRHWLINGMYGRLIFIPAGTAYVGRVHKTDHFFIILHGRSTMTTDDGPQSLEGPMILEVKAGSKRAGIAHTDCFFIAIHRTDKTNLEDIAKDLVEEDPTGRYDIYNHVKPLLEDL